MKSLFEKANYEDILARIDSLNDSKVGKWGKMNVGQMVWHCQVPLKVAIKNKPTKKAGNILIKWFFKKSLYNEKPWRKNLPTTSFARATEEKNFEEERKILQKLVSDFYLLKDKTDWNPHPIFGEFTPDQWGAMQYKHLDHHLRQFGV